ncbi:S-ribosylhomocysteine lyase [Jeotgalibacillus sp. ET6]|nr:S-ribosylhomocysteine lyase [Jeotgalibacillus sp. ET6]MDG5473989.1 S-ribosylhomocysteine lyase [Jeotgalibacillus sp. ET6]
MGRRKVNEVQCGWAANHSLEGAKEIAHSAVSAISRC